MEGSAQTETWFEDWWSCCDDFLQVNHQILPDHEQDPKNPDRIGGSIHSDLGLFSVGNWSPMYLCC